MGADVVRITCEWSTVQPTNASTFDWTIPDMLFDAADALGLRVLFILLGTPGWARTAGESSNAYPPTDVTTFGPFCTAAVKRYKGRGIKGCHEWEIWNEPNGSFGFGATSYAPSKYASLLAVAYAAIKAADPAALVITGGVDGGAGAENFSGNGSDLDTHWIANQYAAGWKGHFDVLAVHPYAKAQDPASTVNTGLPTGGNLVGNGTFDTDASGWFGDNATIARVTSPTRSGAGSLQVTITGATFPGCHYQGSLVTTVPGTNYLGQAWVQGNVGDTVHLTLNWLQSDGSTGISFTQGYDVTLTTNGWQLITARGLAPALAARCRVAVNDSAGSPIGHVFYVDDVTLNVATPTSHGWNHISQIRALMIANSDPKPIWVTEVGQSSGTSAQSVAEATQATYIANMISRLRGLPYVERLYLHQDIDSGTDTTVDSQNFGLTHTDGSPKPAFAAFRDAP